jgi:hypothetical protein
MSEAFVATCRALGAAVALTGVALLFVVEHGGPDEFVYFTTQSNILVGCCFLWGALAPLRRRRFAGPPDVVRGGVAFYILVTFLVFHLVLANPSSGFGNGSQQFGTTQNVLLHTVTPLLALLDWVTIRAERPQWRWSLVWLTYPLAYLAFALVRGEIVHRYPYPFLDVRSLGYGGVAIVASVLLVLFWLLGLLVVALGRLGGYAVPRVRATAAEADGSPAVEQPTTSDVG